MRIGCQKKKKSEKERKAQDEGLREQEERKRTSKDVESNCGLLLLLGLYIFFLMLGSYWEQNARARLMKLREA